MSDGLADPVRDSLRPPRYGWVAALIALALFVWGTHPEGLAVTPDSVDYLAAAESLAHEGTLTDYDGQPYVSWPPLYPTLLSVGGLLGASAIDVAWWLNALALVGIVLVASLLSGRLVRDRVWAAAATGLVTVGYPLHFVAGKVWSESVFVLLVLASALAAVRYAATPSSRVLLAGAACTALAMLQRTAGISVAGAWIFTILLVAPGASIRLRLLRAGWFGAIVGIPTAVWVARVVLVSGTITGIRGASSYTWAQDLHLFLRTLIGWFVPGRLLSSWLVIALPALVAVGVGLLAREWRRAGPARPMQGRAVQVSLAFVAAYTLLILYAARSVNLDPIDDRLLSPLFPFVALLGFVAVERGAALMRRVGVPAPARGTVLLILTVALVAKPARTTLRSVTTGVSDGHWNYNSERWRDSEVVARLRAVPRPGVVFSNRPDAVWFQTGLRASLSPMNRLYNSPQEVSEDRSQALDEALETEGSALLAWFDRADRGFLYPLDELRNRYRVTELVRLGDGGLYVVESR